ncbi:MAG: thioredoxin family protein [Cyclobacteriaceae bacterium]|nr:thioredoxin family protein [Cyclobacteriaceae bacterium]
MKKILITLVVLFTVTASFAQIETASAAGIKFETGTWAEILAKAKQQNKYVFVDAFTTWCGPCKWMDKNVFPTAEAGEYFNKNFVNAKIDMEKGEGLDIAKKYNVQAYPTYLYVDGDGNLVHRVVGSMETPKFIAASSNALDPNKQYGTLLRKFDGGDRNPDFLYNAAFAAQSAYDNKKAQEIGAAYLKTQSNLLEEKNVKFISQFTGSATDPNFEFMRKNASAFEASMGGKEQYNNRMYQVAFQSSYADLGVKRDMTKEQAPEYIAKANDYFKKVLPEQQVKLSSNFAMNIYRITKDWDSFAKAAIAYYDNNSSVSSMELNSIAWTFYESIDNPEYLKKALGWGLQSVKMSEEYANTDTVASLYSKLGDKKNAKLYAEKAIELGKASGQDVSSTEKLLKEVVQ